MELDKKAIKALSSDTRIDILKALRARRKMPSEISRELGIASSTVVEHLKILSRNNLVGKVHTGHKWIYYELTPKGVALVKTKFPVQFVILLSIGILLVVGGFYNITAIIDYEFDYPIVTITKMVTGTAQAEALSSGEVIDTTEETDFETTSIPIEQINWLAVTSIIIGSLFTIFSMKEIVEKWLT